MYNRKSIIKIQMRIVGLLVLSLMVLGLCKPVDKSVNFDEFWNGYFKAMQVKADISSLSKCLDKAIIGAWNRVVTTLAKVDWDDPVSVLVGLTSFLRPALDNVRMVEPCDKEEIAEIYQKIEAAINKKENFTRRIVQNIELITDGLKNFARFYKSASLYEAGSTSGAMMFWLFLG